MKRTDYIDFFEWIGLLIIYIVGSLLFGQGFKTDDWTISIAGLAIIGVGFLYSLLNTMMNIKKEIQDEMDELKTELAILENRCDWIEDETCKEFKEE